jgi:3-oxoacyl-[acyl-carrier protein] reductase
MSPDAPNPGTVLVVGGASGIGFASARLLGLEGWRVVVADRDEAGLVAAGQQLDAESIDIATHVIDVRDVGSVDRAFDRVASDYGLNSVINTAGVVQFGTVLDVEEDEWSRVIDINLSGTYRSCRAAVRLFLAGSGGTIVNLASQSGRTSSFYAGPNYVASKAGIIGLTMAIAAQHASQGIRANAIAPGLVETPLIKDAYTAEQRTKMTNATPMGRFATPDEVAEIAVFLASNKSSYMTGQTLNANGGSFMQ